MLRVFSLFSGIGAFEKALTNLNIPHELVGISEIDKFAIKFYCAIHGVDENLNFGDITKWAEWDFPENIDLLTHGSPCFTGDTLVMTNHGFKEIKDVQVGDYVLTHNNRYQKVVRHIHNGKKNIWTVKGMGTHGINTTENHKFLTRERYWEWHNPTRKKKKKI